MNPKGDYIPTESKKIMKARLRKVHLDVNEMAVLDQALWQFIQGMDKGNTMDQALRVLNMLRAVERGVNPTTARHRNRYII